MKRHAIICSLTLAMLVWMQVASIRPVAAEELYRESAEVNSMMTKLGRGLTNILTAPMEIPKQIDQSIRATDPFSGTVVGLCKGLGWGFAREACGIFETVSFPFPVPKDYAPIIEPEFIFKDLWGKPIPIICDPKNNWDEPVISNK